MRTGLRIGVAVAFVLVVIGAPFSALAITAVVALIDRLGPSA